MTGAIILDRGDRPYLTASVTQRLLEQVDIVFPTGLLETGLLWPDHDIVQRLQWGIDEAKEYGCDFVYLIENDDYYSFNYVQFWESIRTDCDIVNASSYTRYHLGHRYFQKIGPTNRGLKIGGLFTMGLKPEVLDDFWQWVEPTERHVDHKIIEYAYREKLTIRYADVSDAVAIKGHHQGKYKKSVHEDFKGKVTEDYDLRQFYTMTDSSFFRLHF